MNDTNNQPAEEETTNSIQNRSYAVVRRSNHQQNAVTRAAGVADEEEGEDQEQIVTSTSCDTQQISSSSGSTTSTHAAAPHLSRRIEALITSPARITSSTGNDCSSSPHHLLSTNTYSGSGSGRPSISQLNHGDITTTDVSTSEDESQSPHHSTLLPASESFIAGGRNVLKLSSSSANGSSARPLTRAAHAAEIAAAMPTTSAAAANSTRATGATATGTATGGGRKVEAEVLGTAIATRNSSNSKKNSSISSNLSNGSLDYTRDGGVAEEAATGTANVNRSRSRNMVAREQTAAVAASSEAGSTNSHTTEGGGGPGPAHQQIMPAEQTRTETHKIILKLPKTSARSSESPQRNAETAAASDGSSGGGGGGAETSRKVEPLKINLHTHNPNTNIVPKITIKPIVKKQNENETAPLSSDCSSSAEDDATSSTEAAASTTRQGGAQIPKLTIKGGTTIIAGSSSGGGSGGGGGGSNDEPHIVPKLTIRSSANDGSDSTIVPKLTIKMADTQGGGGGSQLSPATTNQAATSSKAADHSTPPLPKLTIKTSVDGTSESIMSSTISPASSSASSSSSSHSSAYSSSAVGNQTSMTLSAGGATASCTVSSNANNANAVPKLTIKTPKTPKHDEVVPKLTIKTNASGTCISSSSSVPATDDEVVEVHGAGSGTGTGAGGGGGGAGSKIPKLTIKTGQEHAVIITQHNADNSNAQLIPKMTIKTKSLEVDEQSLSDLSSEDPPEKIPKITIKTHESSSTETPLTPKSKFCIKTTTTATQREQCETDHAHHQAIPKLTISMSNLVEGGAAPQSSPKQQSPLVVRQLASSSSSSNTRKTNDSPERLPKLMITRQEALVNNCDAAAAAAAGEKLVPKLTIKTTNQSQDGGGSGAECLEKIPKITIKSIPNVQQQQQHKQQQQQQLQSSEESDDCLSGESSPPTSAAEAEDTPTTAAANKVVPKLTIKNLSSPTLKMKAVLGEDKTQRTATTPTTTRKCGKSSESKAQDANATATKSGTTASTTQKPPPVDAAQQQQQSLAEALNTRGTEMLNGCESVDGNSQEFCGFNDNNSRSFAQQDGDEVDEDIQEPRRNSDDMDIDEGLQQHDPQVFNNVFHQQHALALNIHIESSEGDGDTIPPPPAVEDLSNVVVDTVDLTSSPSPCASPAHFNYTDADPQIGDAHHVHQAPQAAILMERLQREMSVIQTAPPPPPSLDMQQHHNSFLLNQLNAPLNAAAHKYGAPPPLQPKPPHSQSQSQQQPHGNHHQLQLPQQQQQHLQQQQQHLQQQLQQLQQLQQQQQQQISNSLKYPQLTERLLMANGARVPRNTSTITSCPSSVVMPPMNNAHLSGGGGGSGSVNMAGVRMAAANRPEEKVIDSIEILDTPEGSPHLTLEDTAALPDNLHINNEDGLNGDGGGGGADSRGRLYDENSVDILRRNNNNNMENASSASVGGTSLSVGSMVGLKRHAPPNMSALMLDNNGRQQCIEITPNKVRRIDSESHTMATLTILTDDESSNAKLITTSPTIFGGNHHHHVVDITNDVASTDNATITTMDLSASPKTTTPHHPRKQRHEHLMAIPLDEENTLHYGNDNNGAAAAADGAYAPTAAGDSGNVASKVATPAPADQLAASAPPTAKKRGRPRKILPNNITPAAAASTAVGVQPPVTSREAADTPPSGAATETPHTADEVSRRVELLRKRLAIDMVAAEQPPPVPVLESAADAVNDSEASRGERALRTARTSRRSVLPAGATPLAATAAATAKVKPGAGGSGGNNGEMPPMKNRKRPLNNLESGVSPPAPVKNTATNNITANPAFAASTPMPDTAAVSVLNHYGGSNSSLSSACSSSSMSSATVTTTPAAFSQPSSGCLLPAAPPNITLASQIDLTMCSSSSSTSNGGANITNATTTIAGGDGSAGAINVTVQNQSSSSMLPPATILSSSDPVPDVVFRPNDFSSLMVTQQLRGGGGSIETNLLRMQTKTMLSNEKLNEDGEQYGSESDGGGANGSGAELSGDDSTQGSMSTPVGRGRGGRGGRGRGLARGSARGNRSHRLGRGASSVAKQIALSRPRCVGGLKHTPDPDRMKGLFTPSPQVFEEDTRMSADLTQTPAPQTPIQAQLPTTAFETPTNSLRQPDFLLTNDESQSSVVSTNSILDPNNVAAVQNGSAVKQRPKKKKMEVCVAEDAEITVSAIAEYDWPPPKGCCPSKNRDTFMIQEQVALYLGIKSFKRKYPDLPRRQIDMEERNWLQEKGLVSERMCDLGITAVWASDILDIMYADFYEKYEEYKDFIRQKHLREIEAKQKALGLNVTGRGLQVRDRALLSASKWNAYFNRSRKEERLACMDLQTFTVNVPCPATAPTATLVNRPVAEAVAAAAKAEQIPEPPTMLRPRRTTPPRDLDANYPVALIAGQYGANYRQYTPLELSCFPLETVLMDPRLLVKRIPELGVGGATKVLPTAVEDVKPSLEVGENGKLAGDETNATTKEDNVGAPTAAATGIETVNGAAIGTKTATGTAADTTAGTETVTRRRSRRARQQSGPKSASNTLSGADAAAAVDDSATESVLSSSGSDSESETDSNTDSDDGSSDTSTSASSSSGEEDEDEDALYATCGVCRRAQNCNQKNLPELFIRCYTCRRRVHPSCIEMPHRMVARVRNYNWQCFDCKCCIKCKGKQYQNKMLFCEQCDRGFHIYCLGLKTAPDVRWSCDRCSICMRCGATKPEGLPQPTIAPNGEKIKPIKHKKVKWIHEYRIDHITKLREHCSMLCVPCGRARNFRRAPVGSASASNATATQQQQQISPPASVAATTSHQQQQKHSTRNQTQSSAASSAAAAATATTSRAANQAATTSRAANQAMTVGVAASKTSTNDNTNMNDVGNDGKDKEKSAKAASATTNKSTSSSNSADGTLPPPSTPPVVA